MKNKLLYIAILLFLCACSGGSESNTEIIKDFKLYNISGDVVVKGDDDLIVTYDLVVTDSLLTIINFDPKDTFFYAYNLNTFEKDMAFGNKGRGPDDFLFPQSYNNMPYSKLDEFQVFDANLVRTFTIYQTPDSVSISSERLPAALVGAFNMSKTENNIYYGIKAGDADPDGLFFIYNSKNDKLEWVKYSSPNHKNVKSPNKFFLYYNYLTVNGKENLVVTALRHFNKILFYDLEGNPLKTFQIGGKELFPKWNESNNDMDYSSVTYFLDMCVTDKFIYCLWVELGGEDIPIVNSKVFVFNWDMRHLGALQLDRPVWRIAASKDDHFIYAAQDDGTGVTDIVRYDITDVLKDL